MMICTISKHDLNTEEELKDIWPKQYDGYTQQMQQAK